MHRLFNLSISLPLWLWSLGATAHSEVVRCETPDIDIKSMSGELPPSAIRFAREIPTAIRAVCEWWGPTYNGPFHIVLNNVLRESMALVPAWYGKIGYIFFPDSVLYRRGAATVHEVTHVFAPNANRFLAEGLAVYAHEHLMGPPAFPNFGADVKMLARKYADRASIGLFDTVATPTPLRVISDRLEEREIYVVAGSFVRFLITDFGLAKFRELYEMTPLIPGTRAAGSPERWERIYGLTIDELALKWRDSLNVE